MDKRVPPPPKLKPVYVKENRDPKTDKAGTEKQFILILPSQIMIINFGWFVAGFLLSAVIFGAL